MLLVIGVEVDKLSDTLPRIRKINVSLHGFDEGLLLLLSGLKLGVVLDLSLLVELLDVVLSLLKSGLGNGDRSRRHTALFSAEARSFSSFCSLNFMVHSRMSLNSSSVGWLSPPKAGIVMGWLSRASAKGSSSSASSSTSSSNSSSTSCSSVAKGSYSQYKELVPGGSYFFSLHSFYRNIEINK